MIEKIIAALASFVIAVISKTGLLGVIILMGIESACIPLPSEIIMPFAGYLVFNGHFTLVWADLSLQNKSCHLQAPSQYQQLLSVTT